ncbi:MAG: aminotransferase class IV [Nanoarchaeota archaeon]|nr:aminotransferase class IV [Nanoarchaeota archaeon]MBU4116395.1 aminotransferase class IV [Nanoarchaeota archaeon]
MNYVILNGKLIEKQEATISVFNKAMFFDFAVYDSVKIIKGKKFFPDFHVERLINSAKIIQLEHDFKKQDIMKWMDLLIEKNNLQDALIRFLLLGAASPEEKPQLFLFSLGVTFYNEKDYKKGIKVITFKGERTMPQSKSKDLFLNFIALREASKHNAQDALLIDSEGYIREGTRTNFFAVKQGKLYTAPLSDVVGGITRKIVIKIAKQNNIEVIERKIHNNELKDFDEFFITSTSMNVLPINQINDYILDKNSKVLTKKIIKLFKDYYHQEVFND